MSVIITGGSGFIGLALAEALKRTGQRCILFGRTPVPTRFAEAFADTTSLIGDICNPADVNALFEGRQLAGVVHLAAVTPDLKAEMSDPAGVIGINVGGIANVMRSLSRLAARPRLILASSVAVYGNDEPAAGSFSEDHAPLKPVSLYGISKLAAESVALRLAELYHIDLRIVRLGPVFGPWEYATGLRPVLSPHGQVLDVWRNGNEAVLPRALLGDWLYSRDAGQGIVTLLQADKLRHTIYNLGAGVSTSVADWCERFQSYPLSWGWRFAEPRERPNIQFSLPRDRAPLDVHRLEADTGFRPSFTGGRAIDDHLAWLAGTGAPSPW